MRAFLKPKPAACRTILKPVFECVSFIETVYGGLHGFFAKFFP
jgi:hypothetical protein